MSVLMPTAPVAPIFVPAVPRPKLWTCDEFHRLGDEGWFEQSRPVLIRGEILEFLESGFPAGPSPKKWSCDEFHRLGDKGIFEGTNSILIEGEILEMPAAGALHDSALTLLDEVLRKAFSAGFVVRGQMSLVLSRSIDPVPDLAIVAGSARSIVQKPTTAALVVDVSDSSLDYDTGNKASLYASAGIADYWVLDLVNRQLVIFRDPQPDSTQPFGFTYVDVTTNQPGQSVSPLAAPGAFVPVDDVLP